MLIAFVSYRRWARRRTITTIELPRVAPSSSPQSHSHHPQNVTVATGEVRLEENIEMQSKKGGYSEFRDE